MRISDWSSDVCSSYLLAAMPTYVQAQSSGARNVAAANERARVQPRAAGWQGARQTFVYTPRGLDQVTAAVGRVRAIVLQEGESMSAVGAVADGDQGRVVLGSAAGGTGPNAHTTTPRKTTT